MNEIAKSYVLRRCPEATAVQDPTTDQWYIRIGSEYLCLSIGLNTEERAWERAADHVSKGGMRMPFKLAILPGLSRSSVVGGDW